MATLSSCCRAYASVPQASEKWLADPGDADRSRSSRTPRARTLGKNVSNVCAYGHSHLQSRGREYSSTQEPTYGVRSIGVLSFRAPLRPRGARDRRFLFGGQPAKRRTMLGQQIAFFRDFESKGHSCKAAEKNRKGPLRREWRAHASEET